MKLARQATLAIALLVLLSGSTSALELDGFLAEIDVRAHADIGIFHADLSATFDISSGDVDALFEVCDKPSDVYLALRIGELTKEPLPRVIEQYRVHKGKGWGVIAKNLGIKPGSAEFHALKKGRLSQHPAHHKGKGKGKGKGKTKG